MVRNRGIGEAGEMGVSVAGAAASYSGASMVIQPWTEALASESSRARAVRDEAQRQCAAKANPDFDTLVN